MEIQLTVTINFISAKDVEEERVTSSKSSNIKFTFYDDANKSVFEIIGSLNSRYQGNLETSMKGSGFIFNSGQLMHYKFHGVNFRRGGLYNDSPDWMEKRKTTINPSNKDDKCFQYG